MSYRDLADQIRESRPCAGASRVVAIDGPAGSGKSVFAERLSTVLSAKVICLDDLTPSWTGPDREADLLVQQVLLPLSQGMHARFHFFDWVKDQYTEWRDVPPDPILLVEGVGAGSRIVRPFVSQLIWVESPSAVRLERGLARDGTERLPEWERWRLREDALFAREATRAAADLLVDGAPTKPHDSDQQFVLLEPAV
jgi:uridine kinase